MTLQDILSVGLTAEDFDLLLKGMDAIPESESWSEMSKEMMLLMLAPTQVHMEQRMQKMTKRLEETKRRQEGKKEDFIVLKSKLILLKRLLLSNEAVQAAHDILNTPPPGK